MATMGRAAVRATSAALALRLGVAVLLLATAPVAEAKKRLKKAQPEVTVVFTEPGPLGLDFSLEKLAGGKFGLTIKGIAEESHAATFPRLKPGMRLVSVDDESGGVVVNTKIKASSPQDLSKLAKTALGEARPITAHFAASPAKKIAKGNAAALITEGTRLGQMGQIPEAVDAMERAVTLKPDWPEAQYNLGIAYDRAGRSTEAVTVFQTALKLKPSLPKPMALTLWETAQAQAKDVGGAAAEQLCDADLAAAHQLTTTYHIASVLSKTEALEMIDSVRANAKQNSRTEEQVVFTHPVFTYYDTGANPTGQPAILETSSEYKRTTREVPKDLFSNTYDEISAAVSAVNKQTWGFDGLVASSMVQHMVAYDAGGDQNTLVGGWWTGGNYNTSTHSKGRAGVELIEYYHTYLQLSSDSDCGGGLVVEIAGGSAGSDQGSDGVLSLQLQNMTLSQGQVGIVPSYIIRRPLPVLGNSCEVVEGTFVGTDVTGRYRSAAVLAASEQAVAAQPQRQQQLRTVLQNNSDYMPLLTQAFNSHELPKLSTNPRGFEIRDVPPLLLKELLEHYETCVAVVVAVVVTVMNVLLPFPLPVLLCKYTTRCHFRVLCMHRSDSLADCLDAIPSLAGTQKLTTAATLRTQTIVSVVRPELN